MLGYTSIIPINFNIDFTISSYLTHIKSTQIEYINESILVIIRKALKEQF